MAKRTKPTRKGGERDEATEAARLKRAKNEVKDLEPPEETGEDVRGGMSKVSVEYKPR